MAASSMKDIKKRIHSIESTRQITKAMELVASSKLRHAKERIEHSRPYFNALYAALNEIAYANTEFSSAYVRDREIKKSCFVIIAGDRGLAGGYNTNVIKMAIAENIQDPICVLPIGKKAFEFCQHHNIEILSEDYICASTLTVSDCFGAAHFLCNKYLDGEFDTLSIAYTNFVSMLIQSPALLKMLPIHYEKEETPPHKAQILYEPSSETVFDTIVPEYVAGMIYGALCESIASELGARRTAMDAASKNAGEMIDQLSLQYNRARQSAITQEITEIVAGAQ